MKKLKPLITVTLVLVLCVVLYYRYANQNDDNLQKTEQETEVSMVDQVLLRDLDKNYPTTPLEVVKFFVKIQKCYYNENNTTNVVEELGDVARKLMDEKLLANNPQTDYFADLKGEISAYNRKDKTISKVLYDRSTDVRYVEVEGVQTASLNCTYYIETGQNLTSVKETYILKKDEDGLWKIYGWELTDVLEQE